MESLAQQTVNIIGGYIHVIGWTALLVAAWRVARFVTKVETRALQSEAHITKMATNCFPTMQASLQNQDKLMLEMNQSLKTIAEQTAKKKRK